MTRAERIAEATRMLRCWWLGCEPHPQEQYHRDDNMLRCVHCGEEVSYGDLVGDTRQNRAREWAHYWLWRKWWPARCECCGGRWMHDETKDHLPF